MNKAIVRAALEKLPVQFSVGALMEQILAIENMEWAVDELAREEGFERKQRSLLAEEPSVPYGISQMPDDHKPHEFSKEQLLNIAGLLPDKFIMEQLMQSLVLVQQIEEGMKSIEEEGGIPHDEVVKQMREYMDAYKQEHG